MATITAKTEFYLSGAWVDVSADVIGAQNPKRGIRGCGPTDRIAGTGVYSFTLDNSQYNSGGLGYYSPDNISCRTGFGIGTKVRWSITDGTTTRYKFFGRIATIEPEMGQYRSRRVRVVARDYMDILASRKLERIPVQTGKRPDELITTIVASLAIAPQNTSYATGLETYEYALDQEQDEKTTAYAALNKVVQSDMGYLFVRGNATEGETLVYENRYSRASTSYVVLNDTMVDMQAERNVDDVCNRYKVTTYPRKLGGTATVVASLDRELIILPGGTITNTFRYIDPNSGGVRIKGVTGTITPEINTDYKLSSTSGSGTALNNELTMTVTWGANSADVEFVNTSTQTGYLWFCQLRATPLYLYNPVETVAEDATSIAAYGEREETLTMPYQDNPTYAEAFAKELRRRNKSPFSNIPSVTYIANRNSTLADAAVVMDIGSRFSIRETLTGINTDYFINSVDYKFELGVLTVTYGVEPNFYPSNLFILGHATYGVLGQNVLGGW